MNIRITPETTISDIQEKFSSVYPYLQIRFSDKPHQKRKKTGKVHWYAGGFCILSIANKHFTDCISLRPWHKTGDVEQELENKLGLHAQIFRRETHEWIETAGTDIFTLNEQNDIGKRITKEHEANLWIEREKLL